MSRKKPRCCHAAAAILRPPARPRPFVGPSVRDFYIPPPNPDIGSELSRHRAECILGVREVSAREEHVQMKSVKVRLFASSINIPK